MQRKFVNGATFLFLYIYIQIFPKGTTGATSCRHLALNDSSELYLGLCYERAPPERSRVTCMVTRFLLDTSNVGVVERQREGSIPIRHNTLCCSSKTIHQNEVSFKGKG